MAERIRANRDSLAVYQTQIGTASNQATSTRNCVTTKCKADELANSDVLQVIVKAGFLEMRMNMGTCSGNSDGRNCLYVAW